MILLLGLIAVLVGYGTAGPAWAEVPTTLAYDGFATGAAAGSYRSHMRPYPTGPVYGTVGFDSRLAWESSTSHFYMRPARMRELKHNLLSGTQPGCLGHWTFNGVRTIRRNLPEAPEAKSGVYTLCLLICTWEHPVSSKAPGGHTTGQEGFYGMIGFTPDNPGGRGATVASSGDGGSKGLSLGYYENSLRAFAGGKSFTIVEGYEMNKTYLLMAEMTVGKEGPEHIRCFYAVADDEKLTPAKFNEENGGKGAEVETWASPADMVELEIFASDPDGGGVFGAPQTSEHDRGKTDFISWDEVRLLDGKATVPVPDDKGDTSQQDIIKAKKTLPAKLAAYWPFDQGSGETANDAVGQAHGKLIKSTWVKDGVIGSAVNFTAKQGPKYGPHHATAVSIPHEAAVAADMPWERHHEMTFSAWVRGGDDFKGNADIITKANGAKVAERAFADIKGLAFMVSGNKLEFELVNSINFPQPDMRIKVKSNLDVPGDGKWHHVAVTYDGTSKPAGVTFYVDGVKNEGFSFDFANLPNQPKELTDDIGVLSPYCIGGRDRKSEKDGVSATGCGYAMVGDIDEVGAFTYVLAPGEVIAIHSLTLAEGLKYNLTQVNQLIELYRAKEGSLAIGDRTWLYVAGGLKGSLGEVTRDGGKPAVRLSDDGSGVQVK
jgi:hypothetical protein